MTAHWPHTAHRTKFWVAALVGMGVLLPSAALADCKWYVQTALKQQQENERLGCGFTGPEWTTDLDAHATWCATVSPDAAQASAKKRDVALKNCAAKAQ